MPDEPTLENQGTPASANQAPWEHSSVEAQPPSATQEPSATVSPRPQEPTSAPSSDAEASGVAGHVPGTQAQLGGDSPAASGPVISAAVPSTGEALPDASPPMPEKTRVASASSLARSAATAEEREALKRAMLEDLEQEIEGELQAALPDVEKAQTTALQEPSVQTRRRRRITEPATRKGLILAVTSTDVYVDIGGRTQGILPLEQFPDQTPQPGQHIEVTIKGYDEENGLVLLERPGIALQRASWASINVGALVEARVTAVVKGGLEVDVNGIRGFIPASRLDLQRVEDLSPYVGQQLQCQVVEADPEQDTLILSRREILEKQRQQAQEQLWHELAEGQVRTGVVRSVSDYGAFIDLGHGVEGLLHVSEMSWGRRVRASEILQLGQEVRVAIIRLDRANRRIGLSLKQVQGDPWSQVEDKYPVGTVVTGKVTRLAEFGAFVELEPGLEGLVHISELRPQRVRSVEDVVRVGQEVRAQVIKVDRAAHKLSLSIKAVQAAEEEFAPPPARRTAASERRRPLKGGLD